jgi:hypothetical protein
MEKHDSWLTHHGVGGTYMSEIYVKSNSVVLNEAAAAMQPVVPVGSKEGGAESGAAKSPPKAGGASTVSETRVSNDEAAKLGLPPGTLWFDPTNKGQMDMIAAQVGGGQKAEAAPPASKLPRSSGQSIRVPPVASLPREEVDGHFQALGVAWSSANLDAIKRAYKILAFSRVEDEGELAAITLSYKICEGMYLAHQASHKIESSGGMILTFPLLFD